MKAMERARERKFIGSPTGVKLFRSQFVFGAPSSGLQRRQHIAAAPLVGASALRPTRSRPLYIDPVLTSAMPRSNSASDAGFAPNLPTAARAGRSEIGASCSLPLVLARVS